MKASAQYRVALATGAGFAALVAGLALATIAAIVWPRAEGWPQLAVAQQSLAADAYARTPADPSAGAAAARRLVAVAPADGPAWLAVAYAELAQRGRLTPAALTAFERSYAVMPFDPDRTSWRLRALLEHWPEVPPELRRQALAELAAKGADGRRLAREIRNPAGRLAAVMAAPPPAPSRRGG